MKIIKQISGRLEKKSQKMREAKCDHEWQIWWEWELKIFLGLVRADIPRFLCLSGEQSVKYCPKCGKVEKYIFVPSEEELIFDNQCYHIRRDKDGSPMVEEEA